MYNTGTRCEQNVHLKGGKMDKHTRISKDDYEFLAKTSSATGLSYSAIIKLALAEWKSSKSYSKLMLGL